MLGVRNGVVVPTVKHCKVLEGGTQEPKPSLGLSQPDASICLQTDNRINLDLSTSKYLISTGSGDITMPTNVQSVSVILVS